MIGYELLTTAAMVLGGLLLVALLATGGHGVAVAADDVLLRRHRRRARAALARAVERRRADDEDVKAFKALPVRERIVAVVEIATALEAADRAPITAVAERAGLITWAVRRTRSRRWRRRLQGARLLTILGAGGEHVLPLLDDRAPVVRTQAAEWAGAHGGEEEARALAARLGEPNLLSRAAVVDALIRLGPAAIGPVHEAIKSRDPEVVRLALLVAEHVGDLRLGAAAADRVEDAQPAVRASAASALAAVGGEEHSSALVELLDDDDVEVRRAAAGSLGRLQYWPAGPRLAAALRDPAWDVRHESARALRRMGPAGAMLLERATRDEDRFARDMARQTLDLPGAEGP